MKMMVLVVAGLLVAAPVFAQEKAVGTFDTTLETLRQSVADLAKTNQALNVRNAEMRSQIKVLNNEVRSLETDARRLEVKKAAQLEKAQQRTKGPDALKARLGQADEELKKLVDESALIKEKIDPVEAEERVLQQKADALNADIAALSAPGGSASWNKDIAQAQAVRDQLQLQLDDVLKRVQDQKRAWQEMNTLVSTGPQQVDVLKAEQEALGKAVPQAEADLARINAQLTEAQAALEKLTAEDYSDVRVARMESEVKDLGERNRKMETDTFTAQKMRDEKLRRSAQEKEARIQQYETSKAELSRRNTDLRNELDQLRKQMVALDKKKSLIEQGVFTQD